MYLPEREENNLYGNHLFLHYYIQYYDLFLLQTNDTDIVYVVTQYTNHIKSRWT